MVRIVTWPETQLCHAAYLLHSNGGLSSPALRISASVIVAANPPLGARVEVAFTGPSVLAEPVRPRQNEWHLAYQKTSPVKGERRFAHTGPHRLTDQASHIGAIGGGGGAGTESRTREGNHIPIPSSF